VGTKVLVRYGHEWACVKVDDCYDLFSAGTLTRVKRIEMLVKSGFASECM
jgi:hypothetical protein